MVRGVGTQRPSAQLQRGGLAAAPDAESEIYHLLVHVPASDAVEGFHACGAVADPVAVE